MGTVVKAAGFIVYRTGANPISFEYLMLKASYGKHEWSFPKGHVDRDEDEISAAARETEEESGLSINSLMVHKDFEQILSYPAHGKPKTVKYWLAKLVDPSAKVQLSSEHEQYRWLPIEDVVQICKFNDMTQLIKKTDLYLRQSC